MVVRSRLLLLALIAVAVLILLKMTSVAAQQSYRFRIPLGIEVFHFTSAEKLTAFTEKSTEKIKSNLYLFALAEAPQFEGWRPVRDGRRHLLLNSAGTEVFFYPPDVAFRVTASTRTDFEPLPAFPVAAPSDLNAYLLHLRFQIALFHGLKERHIAPEQVRLIGVPADLASPERIYQLLFHLEHVPITDRCVLEVYSPSGERLARFHLDLM